MKIIYHICRFILGLTFIFSGFTKGIDPIGSSYKFIDYFTAWGLDSLTPLATLAGVLLALLEFSIGVALICNLFKKITAMAALVFCSFFLILTLYIAIKNPVTDCGCFGDAIKLGNWETFYKNIVLFICAVIIVHTPTMKLSGARCRISIYIGCTLLSLYLILVAYSSYFLPVIDFRPYREGTNIIEAMSIPESAPKDEYKNTFIYKNLKTGKEQEFDETNYPWQDTLNWVYVDLHSTLVTKGYEPPIHDFYMMTSDAEDVKDFFLYDELPVFILASSHVEKMKWKNRDEIANLINFCDEKHMSFVGLTASAIDEANKLSEMNGLHIDFLNCDEVALKTMIRSNPGLILIINGTIIKKWSGNDLPTIEEAEKEIVKFNAKVK
ncbi:MAG: BT_3928 family protein [Mangrovibacterium sp.]